MTQAHITNLPNVSDVTVNFKELALKEINKLGDKCPVQKRVGRDGKSRKLPRGPATSAATS
jgi:hypothetical protein